jgi:hypothetical protein
MLIWHCKRPRFLASSLYNGSHIPDPDPKMSVEQVRELLTHTLSDGYFTGTMSLQLERESSA